MLQGFLGSCSFGSREKKKFTKKWKLERGPRAWPTERTYGREKRMGGGGLRPEAREPWPESCSQRVAVNCYPAAVGFQLFFLFKSLHMVMTYGSRDIRRSRWARIDSVSARKKSSSPRLTPPRHRRSPLWSIWGAWCATRSGRAFRPAP